MIIFLICWVLIGLLASVFYILSKRDDGFDIRVYDLLTIPLCAVMGCYALLFVFIVYLEFFCRVACKVNFISRVGSCIASVGNKVIIKGKNNI
jgi:hypothetical protein